MFGGDDVNAIVVDLGTHSVKAGWAGEDAPRHILPAWYGHVPEPDGGGLGGAGGDVEMGAAADDEGGGGGGGGGGGEGGGGGGGEGGGEGGGASCGPLTDGRVANRRQVINGRRFLYGDNALSRPFYGGAPAPGAIATAAATAGGNGGSGNASARAVQVARLSSAEHGTFLISDVDASEGLWWHLYASCLKVHPTHSPLLVCERLVPDIAAGQAAREGLAQLLFEKLRVPALYVAKAPVLTAFACGRPTALVLDVGARESTATAVHDGFALHKSLQVSPLGGDALTAALRARFAKRTPPVQLRPLYSLRASGLGALPGAPGLGASGPGAPGPGAPGPGASGLGAPAGADASFDEFSLLRLVADAKAAACAVSESALPPSGSPELPAAATTAAAAAARGGGGGGSGGGGGCGGGGGGGASSGALLSGVGSASYELPYGQGVVDMAAERLELAELLFKPSAKLGTAAATAAAAAASGGVGGADVAGVAGDGGNGGVDGAHPSLHRLLNGGPSRSAAVAGYELPPNSRGLTELVTAAIAASDPDIRRELYAGVVLAGGGSLFPGLAERLQSELAHAVPQMLSLKVKVLTGTTAAERMCASWIGASILGSLGSFQQLWVSRAEWEEEGASAMHKKCP